MTGANSFRNDWATKDFYQVLGVAQDASAADIRKAYRKLARENHPDSNPGNDAKHDMFKVVAEAYDVLSDLDKRKKYDEFRALQAGGASGAGMGGGGFGGGDGSGRSGDMFGDIFGGGARGHTPQQVRPSRGADVETTATIGFTDALQGVTVSLRLTSDAACATCQGTGGKPGTRPRICPTCEGAGFLVSDTGGAFSINETCPTCGGRQLIYEQPCSTCQGSGRATSARSIEARIPAGVNDGARIRLDDKGAPGEQGGPPGDLFVTVKVNPHRVFGRKGDNLTLDVPVSFDEAALGAEVKIPTLGGAPLTLKLPPGTPNGRTFRVRGKGATRRDGTKGDLLATVEVQVPTSLDQAASEVLEAYRAATASEPLRSGLFES